MKNLKITIYPSSPIWINGIIMLDSILMYIFLLKHGITLDTHTTNVIDLPHIDMFPIKRIENGDKWYYACSCGLYEAKNEFKSSIKKRIDTIEKMFMKGDINIGSGFYKAYDIRFMTIVLDKIEFYCIGTDYRIKELLEDVWAIGKKHNIGYGKISRFTIEEIKEDISSFLKIRPIPIETEDIKKLNFDSGFTINRSCTYRPPYWDISQSSACIMPETISQKEYLVMSNLMQEW